MKNNLYGGDFVMKNYFVRRRLVMKILYGGDL